MTKQKSTQQVQFLNYISEKRQTNSAVVGSETVLVICATLRAKHPDLFGPLKFGDGALESYIQHCRVTVFDASDPSNSISFPHVICEFERAVTTPFIVLQVRAFVQGCIPIRLFETALYFDRVLLSSCARVVTRYCQGSVAGEIGREKFPVEFKTFQTFGLFALLQRVYVHSCVLLPRIFLCWSEVACDAVVCDNVVFRYVSDSRITASGSPPAKIMFFDIDAYRRHSIS